MFVGDSLVSLPLWCALWSSACYISWVGHLKDAHDANNSFELTRMYAANLYDTRCYCLIWHHVISLLVILAIMNSSCFLMPFPYSFILEHLTHFHSSWLKERWNNVNFIAVSPRVSIIMGSDSDLNVMKDAEVILKKFNIPVEVWFLKPFSFKDNLLSYLVEFDENVNMMDIWILQTTDAKRYSCCDCCYWECWNAGWECWKCLLAGSMILC